MTTSMVDRCFFIEYGATLALYYYSNMTTMNNYEGLIEDLSMAKVVCDTFR